MPKAISMVTFIDRDDNDKVYQLKVTVNNEFSVESEYQAYYGLEEDDWDVVNRIESEVVDG